jgi:hypothetical protein
VISCTKVIKLLFSAALFVYNIRGREAPHLCRQLPACSPIRNASQRHRRYVRPQGRRRPGGTPTNCRGPSGVFSCKAIAVTHLTTGDKRNIRSAEKQHYCIFAIVQSKENNQKQFHIIIFCIPQYRVPYSYFHYVYIIYPTLPYPTLPELGTGTTYPQ